MTQAGVGTAKSNSMGSKDSIGDFEVNSGSKAEVFYSLFTR